MSVHTPPPAETPSEGLGSAGPVHKPYVPANTPMVELSWSAVLLGAILGIIFGASSLYLVLRVGMTVSASIPVAVLSITVFRALSKLLGTRPATILENNIVQTTGPAGESIAFGVGVTMPALMILGYDMELVRVMLVAALGGLLGILMMIPLRRAFIVKQHGSLSYPEGTACAKVLIVGEQGGFQRQDGLRRLRTRFRLSSPDAIASGLAGVPRQGDQGIQRSGGFPRVVSGAHGVGYIIGFRIACVMVAGGMLAALGADPGDRLLRGAATAADLPWDQADLHDES